MLSTYFLRAIVGIIGGTYAARYLWQECFLYFKKEKRVLPWPIAAIAGLLFGIPLIVAAIGAYIFMQIENKAPKTNKK